MISILSARISAFILCLLTTIALRAHEGMWLPNTLSSLVIGDMRSAGLKLTAEDIYSINESSLKDAIVHFGGGCTSSLISDKGLLLTNHHCGYSQIQSHSSLENNLLRDGFWAKAFKDELPNPGLTASKVVRIEDVSQTIMAIKGQSAESTAALRAEKIRELVKSAVDGTHYEAEIKPFHYGNAYYMIVTETFRDVRLVGTPPSAIGKFGGDTDNWEWPRHTGDFSIFRIYAGADNLPADYAASNKPYKPKKYLKIDLAGVDSGDFTMVFGFPGKTDQYISSTAVSYILESENPARIEMRRASLGVIDQAMASSDALRIKYAAKQSRISNAYKKWIGQSGGLIAYKAIDRKKELQTKFMAMAQKSSNFQDAAEIPGAFEALYDQYGKERLARTYFIEMYLFGPEILRFAYGYKLLAEKYDSLETAGVLEDHMAKLRKSADGFYKNYDPRVDQDIFAAMLPIYMKGAPQSVRTPKLTSSFSANSNVNLAVAALFDKTIFDDKDAVMSMLDKPKKKELKKLRNDPMLSIANEMFAAYSEAVQPFSEAFQVREDALMNRYVEALLALMPDEVGPPDANGTLRITYGEMEGSQPRDGIAYTPFTTLDGLVAKYIAGDEEFDLPQRLLDLHENGDYGPYAKDGELRVCFLGSNHTTGGNSGSPALNAQGNLVGLNFDRTWESTMSDIMFNEAICRNIMVDIRYVLFIVDRYGSATNLIEEMSLIYPPSEVGSTVPIMVEPDMN